MRAEGVTLLREGPALAQVCETAFPPVQSTGPSPAPEQPRKWGKHSLGGHCLPSDSQLSAQAQER